MNFLSFMNGLLAPILYAIYLSSFQEVEAFLMDNTKEKDIIVTMGAGNIYQVGNSIMENNKKETEKAAV